MSRRVFRPPIPPTIPVKLSRSCDLGLHLACHDDDGACFCVCHMPKRRPARRDDDEPVLLR